MGCRLELNPSHIFECFFEVAAPSEDSPEPKIVNRFPEDFKDVVVDKELPKFCFPYDVGRFNPAGQFFTFVLIGLDNKQRFGFCRHPPGADTCLCILSHLPWFEICYKMLNSLAEFKHQKQLTAGRKLLTQLYTLPVPQAGQLLRLTVSEKGAKTEPLDPENKRRGSEVSYWMTEDEVKEFSFACPDPRALPRIPENRNITEFFSAVDASNMMLLFVSLLYERRVLITSEKLSRLTACVHGAASLLFPFYWQHIYIPVMPAHLIDYCCAPMPFLVGVHASFMPKIRSNPIDEVVILNADTNEIENPFDDIETLPSDIVRQLKNNLKNTAQLSGDGVARAFLKFMVRLIGSYKLSLKLREGEIIVFDKDSFVESRSSHTSECLEKLLQMQHFTQFIDHRVDSMNEGLFIDDAFEEEINNTGDLSSAKWKTAMLRLKDSTASDGRRLLLSTVRGMKSVALEVKKTAQETINTKDFAKDGVSEFKKKMGKGKNGQSKYQAVRRVDRDSLRPRSDAMESNDDTLKSKRTSASEKSKLYKEINFDESRKENENRDEVKRRSSDIDLISDVNEALATMGIKGVDNEVIQLQSQDDDVSSLPTPPRRKHRNSSKSSDVVAPALPPPPVAPPRRRRVPQHPQHDPPDAPIKEGRKNNNNSGSSENLIDIDGGSTLDNILSGASKQSDSKPLSLQVSQVPSNYPGNVPTSPTTNLLNAYGLNFDIPTQQAANTSQSGQFPSRGATGQNPFMSSANSSSHHHQQPSTGRLSLNQKMRLDNPNYEQTYLPPSQRLTKTQSRLANPSYEHTFLPSVPQMVTRRASEHTPRSSNAVRRVRPVSPAGGRKNTSLNAPGSGNDSDPFADLVSIQRTSFDKGTAS
ncbi:DENN domain-containing protein 1A-like isoform X7 [Apostichopus japonicus]|uniref:DENN domain-containing protein 1A-like isoform X7 n=1 Tax=Stichopus japonicus TaxID=307972 RepID=UPI003AB7B34B